MTTLLQAHRKRAKASPLAFVDELLDEERQSNKYFGSLVFIKHFEYLDIAHLYDTNSLEFRNVKLLICEMLFYAIWLLVLTLFVTMTMGQDAATTQAIQNQYNYWGGCIKIATADGGIGKKCAIDDVTDISSLYNWMETELVPRMYGDETEYFPMSGLDTVYALDENSAQWKPRYSGDTKTTVMLGNARLRQLRVKKNRGEKCSAIRPEFEGLLKGMDPDAGCFSKFEESIQSKMTFEPQFTNEKIVHYYKWAPANITQQIEMEGRHAVYPGSGFYGDIPLKKDDAIGVYGETKLLKEWSWMDLATRAIIIELTVFNPSTNIIVNNRILFEFGAFGKIDVLHQANGFRAALVSLNLILTDETGFFVMHIFLCSLFLLYCLVNVFYLYQNGFSEYFAYIWNIVDFGIMLLFFIFFGIRINTFFNTFLAEPLFLPEMLGMPEFFFPFSVLFDGLQSAEQVLAFLTLFAWLRFLKYFTLMDTFRLLVRVLEKTVWDLLVFGALLVTIIIGFATAFHVGYYNNVEYDHFRTWTSSFYTLFFLLTKGISLTNLLADGDWLAIWLFITYLCLVYLLIVNTFMAIVLDTFTIVTFSRYQKTRQFEDSPVWCFLISYYYKLKGEQLITPDNDTDRGELDEQFIDVAAMPALFQERWADKREKIRDLLNQKLQQSDAPVHEVLKLQNELEECERKGIISRVQIQRLLDEDEDLADTLGARKAIDVIRRFSLPKPVSGDPYVEISKLQENVFQKLEEFENSENPLEFSCIESLKLVSVGLHEALTEVQNQWRAELTEVLEATNVLASTLTDMTKQLEKVQMNHTTIAHEASMQQLVKTQNQGLPGSAGKQ